MALPSVRDLSVLRAIHLAAHGALRLAGYKWELRRNGELRIGLWRKKLHKNPKRKNFPKRFVLVPGFGDTPLSWLSVLTILRPILGRQYDELVLLDFPGYGGFLANEQSFHSMDLLLNATHDIFDSLRPHTLMGHSLGGWLTSHYAAQCGMGKRPLKNKLTYKGPEQLILVNPSGAFESPENRLSWENIFRTTMTEGFKALRPHVFKKEPMWFKWIASEFARFLEQEEIIQFMNSVKDEHLVEAYIENIQCQTWLVWSENDTMIPPSCASFWLRKLAVNSHQSRAVILKNVGHSPQIEKPAVTAAVMAQIFHKRVPHPMARWWWKNVELPETA